MGDENKRFDKVPLSLVNIVSVISGLCTVLTTIFAIYQLCSDVSLFNINTLALVASLLFNVILFFRVRRYTQLESLRMKTITRNMHKLLHNARDVYFDIMHSHKTGTLTEKGLTKNYQLHLIALLDNLCSVMKAYTSQEIAACIKLITYGDSDGKIDLNNATLVTFCRSSDSVHSRASYESTSRPILLRDNTDFFEVVSPDYEKNYFYQDDLLAYDKYLRKNGEHYKNSNPHWDSYYRSTIVVPIRIQFDKLYHIKPNDAYHIIGFLCVDSMSTDAFSRSLENYYVDLLYAYADVTYILLGQYRHYLKKFEETKAKQAEGRVNK